jgi:16S rRNA (guanine966-N2)-methyltransferase
MRITGGFARGRRLAVPRGRDVRPTADRVREAIFDRFGPAGVSGTVVDLFAGTGALGLEAISRGASAAILVDRDPRALACCRANAAVLGEASAAVRLVRAEALAFLAGPGRGLGADVAFIDPPYAFARRDEVLAALLAGGVLRPGGVAVVERPAKAPPAAGTGFGPARTARYGDTAVDFLDVER